MRSKKLFYQCTHRGSKEMDFLLGRFAEKSLETLSPDELVALEDILMCDDAPLYAFLAQDGPLPDTCDTPARRALLARIRESISR